MAKLLANRAAYVGVKGSHKIKSMTNDEYNKDKSADERIEKRNRAYVEAYKQAVSYSAK